MRHAKTLQFIAMLAVLGSLAVPASTAGAQSDRGVLTGRVSDPQSAIVVGAVVIARNADTGAEYRTVTTATGDYTLSSLPARRYDLIVEAAGFKTFVSESVLVQVAQTTRVDAALQIGATAEIVSVTAEAPLLKTANAEQGINISGDRLNTLPLNFGGGGGNVGAIRNWLGFVVLAPGVSGTNERASVNGAPGGGFKIYLEGQDVTSSNDTVWTSTVAAASVETIGEFSMQTANFAAEYGQVLGGLFNFTTKSGTNELRGSAYEYLTNEALDGRRPFTGARPISRKHNFGFSVGGPVYIPGLLLRTQQDVLLHQRGGLPQPDELSGRPSHRPHPGLSERRLQRGADRACAGDGPARQADHGEHDLRPAHHTHGQRTGRPRSLPQQRHSERAVRSGGARNPVAHSRAGQWRAAEQLRPGHPEPQESVDPDRQDRPQHRDRNEALGYGRRSSPIRSPRRTGSPSPSRPGAIRKSTGIRSA